MRSAPKRRARAGGRRASRCTREATNFSMLPGLLRNLPLCDATDEVQACKVDDSSMSILEKRGIVFRDEVALQDWRYVGLPMQQARTSPTRRRCWALHTCSC